jgi:hypothetical protein
MCGGAILAELIPSPRRAASKPVNGSHVWPAGSNSKKAGSGRDKERHHHADDIDDFEAAFEDFNDEFDEEVEDLRFVFSSKSAFSPGNRRRLCSLFGGCFIHNLHRQECSRAFLGLIVTCARAVSVISRERTLL